jgi:hypothetical protein
MTCALLRSACITVSTESAMTSRENQREVHAFVAHGEPSETEMVPNCMGNPPPACTPSLAPCASRFSERLQGVDSFQELAHRPGLGEVIIAHPHTPDMPRAGAVRMPSVTTRLCGLVSRLLVR